MDNKRFKNYAWYIAMPLLVASLLAFQSKDAKAPRKSLLIGNWTATYDTLKINICFTATTGKVEYIGMNKKYSFHYAFKNDTIIKMWSGKSKPEYHIVRKLTSDKLLLRAYPDNPYREDISLINAVDFKRVK